MRPIRNPCYDEQTKEQCPYRGRCCFAECEKWKEYETQRNKDYKRREYEAQTADFEIKRRTRIWKQIHRRKTR